MGKAVGDFRVDEPDKISENSTSLTIGILLETLIALRRNVIVQLADFPSFTLGPKAKSCAFRRPAEIHQPQYYLKPALD
ncbi:hypothetical protein Pfo_005996 [Paulownia fortunei]|nr:hypothetical protein Pfo_005996 [Paulownia fortunei]